MAAGSSRTESALRSIRFSSSMSVSAAFALSAKRRSLHDLNVCTRDTDMVRQVLSGVIETE